MSTRVLVLVCMLVRIAAADDYPEVPIERPITLHAQMFTLTAGGAALTYDAALASGEVARKVRGLGFVGASYGLTSRLEATGEVDIGIGSLHSSVGFGQLTFGILSSTTQLAVRGTVAIGSASEQPVELRFGIPYQVQIGARFAITASDDIVRVTVPDGDVQLSLPLGIGVEITPAVYVTAGIAVPTLSANAAVLVVAGEGVDLMVQAILDDGNGQGSMFVRMRR